KQDSEPLGRNHHFPQISERRVVCCMHSPSQQCGQLGGDHFEVQPGLDRCYVALDWDAIDSENYGCHRAFDPLCQVSKCVAEAQSNPPSRPALNPPADFPQKESV